MLDLQKTEELIPFEGETYDVIVAGGGPPVWELHWVQP